MGRDLSPLIRLSDILALDNSCCELSSSGWERLGGQGSQHYRTAECPPTVVNLYNLQVITMDAETYCVIFIICASYSHKTDSCPSITFLKPSKPGVKTHFQVILCMWHSHN